MYTHCIAWCDIFIIVRFLIDTRISVVFYNCMMFVFQYQSILDKRRRSATMPLVSNIQHRGPQQQWLGVRTFTVSLYNNCLPCSLPTNYTTNGSRFRRWRGHTELMRRIIRWRARGVRGQLTSAERWSQRSRMSSADIGHDVSRERVPALVGAVGVLERIKPVSETVTFGINAQLNAT